MDKSVPMLFPIKLISRLHLRHTEIKYKDLDSKKKIRKYLREIKSLLSFFSSVKNVIGVNEELLCTDK